MGGNVNSTVFSQKNNPQSYYLGLLNGIFFEDETRIVVEHFQFSIDNLVVSKYNKGT